MFLSLGLIGFAFFLRYFPQFKANGSLGVDHWYWKLYIETYRDKKQFPPVLPQYLLEEHQWYPPLFPLLMARLPESVFDRFGYCVAVLIDLARMVLLMGTIIWLSNGEIVAVSIAGIVYATTPIVVSYNVQLNPRGLGALFLDSLIIILISLCVFNGPLWLWIPVFLLSGLILLTHKMSTQLFWFLCLGAGILALDWRFLALVPGSIAAAMILSRGFYWKILLAHWDVVTFWYRNWPWIGVHPIKESPIYGEKNYETPGKVHKGGLRGAISHLRYLAAYNPWVWIVFPLFAHHIIYGGGSSGISTWIFSWVISTIVFSLLTVFIPAMKCLGVGYLYLYNVSFPAALLWGMVLSRGRPGLGAWFLFAVGFLACLGAVLVFYRRVLASKVQRVDNEFEEAINYLKNAPPGTVMCFPLQLYDIVAYRTGKDVFYGGHGYGLKLIEPTLPRFLLPVQEFTKRYNIRYLLTLNGYLPNNFLNAMSPGEPLTFGNYKIFNIDENCP